MAILLLAGVSIGLVACTTGQQPAQTAQEELRGQVKVTAQCTIYLVRHAEKLLTPGDRDPLLAPAGQRRATVLAERLAAEPIDRLYASGFQRTQLTLQPLATRLGRDVQIYDAKLSGQFLTDMLATTCRGALIVAGHSNTLPELLRAAGIDEPAVEFDEGRYGELFVVNRQLINGRWQASLRTERFGD